ncbi:CocE/NonD family hydrolase C-terminal non-catalytic domain-containing protein [Nocardia jiangsuensis]|uniref:CocE/NonD family hydrolase C-terminal non-catalytic domain-containing protein n=1 Tax=Nocardia jiangsuensis TaxID=1691563 RepID=A0ABV8DT43_9NOCA
MVTLDDVAPDAVPGEPAALDIALPATEAVLRPGHRLRVDGYAGNVGEGLPMLVDTGPLPQHVQLDPTRPSFVSIPLKGEPRWGWPTLR